MEALRNSPDKAVTCRPSTKRSSSMTVVATRQRSPNAITAHRRKSSPAILNALYEASVNHQEQRSKRATISSSSVASPSILRLDCRASSHSHGRRPSTIRPLHSLSTTSRSSKSFRVSLISSSVLSSEMPSIVDENQEDKRWNSGVPIGMEDASPELVDRRISDVSALTEVDSIQRCDGASMRAERQCNNSGAESAALEQLQEIILRCEKEDEECTFKEEWERHRPLSESLCHDEQEDLDDDSTVSLEIEFDVYSVACLLDEEQSTVVQDGRSFSYCKVLAPTLSSHNVHRASKG